MEAKIFVLLALVAMGHSSVVPVANVNNDYTKFAYDVADPNTGDYKSQVETRVGGNVQGQYSLLESDGTKRIVDYGADDINGFNAIVRKEPAVFGAPVVSGSLVKSTPVLSAASVISGVTPQIVAIRSLTAGSLIAPAPKVASRTVVAQSPAIVSSPGFISAPSIVGFRTYASPTLVAGSAQTLFAAAKSAAVAASAPVLTVPYGSAYSSSS